MGTSLPTIDDTPWKRVRAEAVHLQSALQEALELRDDLSLDLHAHVASAFEPPGTGLMPYPSAFVRSMEAWRDRAPLQLGQANRLACAALLANFDCGRFHFRLPPVVQELCLREAQRVLRQLKTGTLDYSDMGKDPHRKDFALLVGRLIPFGAVFGLPDSGVPRRALLGNGPLAVARALSAIAAGGGWRPWVEIHTHPASLQDFSVAGWRTTYERLAEFLAANPGLRGVIGSSWYRDPALAQISPHLAYLRTIPLSGDAALLFTGWDTAGDSGALSKSAHRRALFELGRYRPRVYMMIWPRGRLMRWAASPSRM